MPGWDARPRPSAYTPCPDTLAPCENRHVMLRKWLFLAPDPAEGGDSPQTATQINQPQTGEVVLPPPAPPGDGAPPPFAHSAATGTKTERELELEREVKRREMEIATLQDKHLTASQRAKALEEELAKRNQPTAPSNEEEEDQAWGFFGRRKG